MPRSQAAQLSPKEEMTLRQIAAGTTSDAQLARAILDRLKAFEFIDNPAGQWKLTDAGRRRHEAISRSSPTV